MDNKQNQPDWNDLPVPDEEQSWQKMKALLDQDDDNKVPPPVFFRTCAGWGLFAIALLAAIWFVVRPDQLWSKRQIAQKQKEQAAGSKHKESLSPIEKENITNYNQQATEEKTKVSKQNLKNKSTYHGHLETEMLTVKTHLHPKQAGNQNSVSKANTRLNGKRISSTAATGKMVNRTNDQKAVNTLQNLPASPTDLTVSQNNPEMPAGVNPSDRLETTIAKDTLNNQRSKEDTSAKSQSPLDEKKRDGKKKLFFLTAGSGSQQQIPIGGQDAFPYNYYGRKGSLSDYIPSAYVRLHKGNKWFVQAEFRYGAPQSVKDFSYSRQTLYDTSTQSLTTTSLYLRKTYYHQIPLSFNYYVKPNWSVGAGGVYSRFYGAVTEEEVKSRNVFTQAEKISRKIVQIPEYNDSFLYKTQLHFMIQTDYQWKRFSFGLRYKKDIQPYIKYTQPDGKVNVKKNQSLEAIIRFKIIRTRTFGM